MPAALIAQLLHVLLDLRLLRRREHVHELGAQLLAGLFAGLRVRQAALRMRLAVLLHDLLDLRFLLVGQSHALEQTHETMAVPVTAMPLALALSGAEDALRRRLARLLCKDGHRGKKRGAQRHGKKKGSKGFHEVVNSLERGYFKRSVCRRRIGLETDERTDRIYRTSDHHDEEPV